MKKKQVKFLKQVVETPSPTGYEVPVAELVRDRLAFVADEIHTDTMGSVKAIYEGALHHSEDAVLSGIANSDASSPSYGQDSSKIRESEEPWELIASYDDEGEEVQPLTLMLAAHMDEVGLMVTYISDDGFLSVSALGGVDAAILPGMRVDVHTEDEVLRGIVGRKPIHLIEADDRKSVTPLDKLVIDLGLPGKVVKEKVRIGDPITYGVGFERFGKSMAVSKAFDDKVGVFIACRVMEKLAEATDYLGNFVAAITVQEEIGTRGAMTSAHSIYPDVAIAFDVTHATDYPGIEKSKYGNIVCGGGPVIARGPNINPKVFERLVAAAEAEGMKYQIEAEPSVTGTDARAIQVTRDGIPTGLVSVPLRYMHTPTEVINLKDVDDTVRLLVRFARDLENHATFVPGMVDPFFADSREKQEQTLRHYEEVEGQLNTISAAVAERQGQQPGGQGERADEVAEAAEGIGQPSDVANDLDPWKVPESMKGAPMPGQANMNPQAQGVQGAMPGMQPQQMPANMPGMNPQQMNPQQMNQQQMQAAMGAAAANQAVQQPFVAPADAPAQFIKLQDEEEDNHDDVVDEDIEEVDEYTPDAGSIQYGGPNVPIVSISTADLEGE